MQQYFSMKAIHPDTLLLFQVGDFYELFFEDAQIAASVLGVALTKRGTHEGEPIPLAGVPLHVRDHYLTKLVKAGYKVALCDQLEEARPGKLVERGITQVLTPGTLTDTKLLEEKSASYLATFYATDTSWTLLCAELLTGQLFVTLFSERTLPALEAELTRFMPDELILLKSAVPGPLSTFFQRQGCMVSYQEAPTPQEQFDAQAWVAQRMHEQIAPESFKGAVTLLYTYLKKTHEQGLAELKQISLYRPEDYLLIDAATQRNLELIKNAQDGSSKHTLFAVLDHAATPMGSRMLKKWILRPLIQKKHIEERLDAVEVLVKDHSAKVALRGAFKSLGDLERIVGRIALKRAHLHDYQALHTALTAIPQIRQMLAQLTSILFTSLTKQISDFQELTLLLAASIHDDTSSEWLIKKGYDTELDRLRMLVEQGAHAVLAFEQREQERTGISSLKVRYNQVHGYGIEITKPNLHLVPEGYLRIQTLANRERFTTQELKDLEYDLKRARADIGHVEKEIFERIKLQVEQYVPSLKKAVYALAYADGLVALAEAAYKGNYSKPVLVNDQIINIVDGRHPVVEMRLRDAFIPNSVELTDEASLWLITGPNMGGKSTFLRQVALISLMAQIGSFVPAAHAQLGIVDRIFTRIGASDNVAEGKSTFLVEMEETALICSQATKQSLVILDEVGRGTSTFDGLAIAQAVVEYLYTTVQARCLFATHYHELTVLCETMPGIKPFYAASMKVDQSMVLLHKILPGVADGSFGLEVAALAHLPQGIVERARQIVGQLTQVEHAKVVSRAHPSVGQRTPTTHDDREGLRLRIQELEALMKLREREQEKSTYLAAQLTRLDYDNLTPKQALDLLWELKQRL